MLVNNSWSTQGTAFHSAMVTGFCLFRCRVVLFFCGIASLGSSTIAGAHSPHDHIEAFELGPAGDKSDGAGYVMLIVVRGNLWRSKDGGENWKRIVRGLDNRHEIVAIACEDSAKSTVWFLKTKNDGVVWNCKFKLSWKAIQRSLSKYNSFL